MARFTRDSVDRVKEAADIVEIVSAHTDLQQRGQDYWGVCPFHDERTPSFKVNPRDKLYYCFGCEASGDVFRFVEEKEGLDFTSAVESLAERYGVELKREDEDPKAEERRRRKARLWELLERTAKFYERYLWEAPKAEKARAYLASRGLDEDVLRRFAVGMAPSAWDQVLTGSQRAGFKLDELQAAGLIQKGRQGGSYDRFRNRITFPIRDHRGRVLGFGARALTPDAKPKYLNSPEGELYRKSHTLYGIDRARGPIAKAQRAIVVEGYTDVLALHQAGVEEAVACMGTAITPDQVKELRMATQGVPIVLALDADLAGSQAMLRSQQAARSQGVDLRVAAMPDGADPAELLQEGRLDRLKELVDAAIDFPNFFVRLAFASAEPGTPAGREVVLKDVAPVLKTMGENTVGFDELVREVADRLDTDPSLVLARVRSAPEASTTPVGEGNGAKPPKPVAVSLTPRETRERALMEMCIASPKVGERFIDQLTDAHLSPSGKPALQWLREHLDNPLEGLPHDDPALVSLITELVSRAGTQPPEEASMQLNFDWLEGERLDDEIAAARRAGDDKRSDQLMRQRALLTEHIARRSGWADAA